MVKFFKLIFKIWLCTRCSWIYVSWLCMLIKSTQVLLTRNCTNRVLLTVSKERAKNTVLFVLFSLVITTTWGVYRPDVQAVFDNGSDWERALSLILRHLRASKIKPVPKPRWELPSPTPVKRSLFIPLLS